MPTDKPIQPNATEEEDEIDLLELFFALMAKKHLLFLGLLAGMLLAGLVHLLLVKPSWQADASIYITNTDSMISIQDLQLSSALTEDYAQIIQSRTVLKQVIQELDLNIDYKDLDDLVEVKNPNGTHIVSIIVTCDDVELSRNIANALLNISIEQIYRIVGSSEPTIIDYSEAGAVKNVSPSMRKVVAIGGLLGIAVVAAIIIAATLMNNTIRTEDDVMKRLQLPVLAISKHRGSGDFVTSVLHDMILEWEWVEYQK